MEFAYSGSLGPKHWGRLSPNFTRCAKGTMQSPVDIKTDEVVYSPNLGRLHRDYTAANATLVDNIYNIAVTCLPACGFILLQPKIYLIGSIVFLFCIIDRCSSDTKTYLGRCRSTG